MPGASLVFANRRAPQPSQEVLEQRTAAAGLLRNFLIALETEGGPKTPWMEFAKGRAEMELRSWGMAR